MTDISTRFLWAKPEKQQPILQIAQNYDIKHFLRMSIPIRFLGNFMLLWQLAQQQFPLAVGFQEEGKAAKRIKRIIISIRAKITPLTWQQLHVGSFKVTRTKNVTFAIQASSAQNMSFL